MTEVSLNAPLNPTFTSAEQATNLFDYILLQACIIDEGDPAFAGNEISRLEDNFQQMDDVNDDIKGDGLTDDLLESSKRRIWAYHDTLMDVMRADIPKRNAERIQDAVGDLSDLTTFVSDGQSFSQIMSAVTNGVIQAQLQAHVYDLDVAATPAHLKLVSYLNQKAVEFQPVLQGALSQLATSPKEMAGLSGEGAFGSGGLFGQGIQEV